MSDIFGSKEVNRRKNMPLKQREGKPVLAMLKKEDTRKQKLLHNFAGGPACTFKWAENTRINNL